MKYKLKQRAYYLAINTIKYVAILDRKDTSVDVIVRQLIRSSTSIGANIIEAQAASSKKDFANFFRYALKSANESKYWLMLLNDLQKANRVQTTILLTETNEISKMLGASLRTLSASRPTIKKQA